MNNIFWPFFVYIWALTYSLYEIEVEAKFGWAKKLPVMNIIKKNKFFPFGLSSWNIFMIVLILFSQFNIPIFTKLFNLGFKQKHTLLILVSLLTWTLIEDFMWFNYNPYFNKDPDSKKYKFLKFAQFNEQSVKWHSFSKFNIPNLYFFISILIIIFISIHQFNKSKIDPLGEINYFHQFLTYGILTILFSFLGKYYCEFYIKTKYKRNKICKR